MHFPQTEDIISTKFSAPILKDSLVFRSRLDEQLSGGIGSRLILINAPAGYGKSTAVAQWLLQQEAVAAWLSLDQDDNDPVRFWRYIIHTLNRVDPGIGEQSLEALQLPGAPLEKVLTILVNEINRTHDEIILIIDDYHLIKDEIIQQAMIFFLNHCPSRLRTCLISRETPPLPLPLYRSRGQLLELTRRELAFTDRELHYYFNSCLNIKLSPETVRQLNSYMEGWIAGLHMLSLAWHNSGAEAILRYKDLSKELFLAEFFVEEILEQQPEEISRFLLFTSVVDQFTPSLGEELSQEMPGAEILQRIARTQLYLLPLGKEGQWYRYHHLFRDVLREELKKRYPGSIPGLYLRAGRWLAREGQTSEAVPYLLQAEAYSEAGALIEQQAPTLFRTGQLKILANWLKWCSKQAFQERPVLRLFEIWVNILAGNSAAAAEQADLLGSIIHSAEAGRTVAPAARDALMDDLLVTRCFLSFILGKPEATREYKAMSQRFTGKGFLIQQMIPFNLHASVLQGEAGMRGNLARAAEFYNQTVSQFEDSAQQFITNAIGYTVTAEIACETGQLARALRYIKLALRVSAGAEDPGILVPIYLVYGRLKMIQGEYAAAQELLRSLSNSEIVSGSPRWSCILESQKVRFALRTPDQQSLLIADEWLTRWGLTPADEISALQEFEYITLLRVLMARGELAEALMLAGRLLPVIELEGSLGSLIELRLLQALGWGERAQLLKSTAALESALMLAEEYGYYRLLLDEGTPLLALLSNYYDKISQLPGTAYPGRKWIPYLQKVMAGFTASNYSEEWSDQSQLKEPLTPRELEIVRLLAVGHSSRAISVELFISPTTVKTHLRNIYRKLGVSSRVQAVARANSLKII
jgi:LuxR family transcriptional regulator, maltose regulon positive regulatory protein